MEQQQVHQSIAVTRRPRPDHPTEKYRVAIRVDLIAHVCEGPFAYTPDDKAAIGVPKNSPLLRGDATFIATVYGVEFVVQESLVEVLAKIEAANRGEPPMPAVST